MLGQRLVCGNACGEELYLDTPAENMLENYIEWFKDSEVTKYMLNFSAFSLEQEKEWFKKCAEDPNGVYWSIMLGDKHIGGTAISRIDWRIGTGVTGIVIGDKNYWWKGVATCVIQKRPEFAFGTLNLNALFTEVFLPNKASWMAAQKAGYKRYAIKPFAGYRDGEYLSAWLGILTKKRWQKLLSKQENFA